VRAKISEPVHTGPGAHPASGAMGTGCLSRGYKGRGVALTTHPPPSAGVKESWGISLLPFWVFMAYSRVNFTFTFTVIYGPGVDSASNRNKYQEFSWGVKAAGPLG